MLCVEANNDLGVCVGWGFLLRDGDYLVSRDWTPVCNESPLLNAEWMETDENWSRTAVVNK